MSKKLLITIDFKPNLGGVARYLDAYTAIHSTDVLCQKLTLQKSLFQDKENIIRKNLLWRWWPKWLPLLFWGCIYARNYEEIIISHILPVGYVGILSRRPYTLILHGLDIINANKTYWKRYWAKTILKNAKHIVVNSRATGELLRAAFGDFYNYEVEYPKIISLPKPREDLREKYDLKNKKIILSLGRLVKRKGQEKIIKLMPRLLQSSPETIFVIAGEGPYKKELEDLTTELKLKDRVMFLGRVPEEDLPSLYSMCDIFVLPAQPTKDNWEGFGMVCLEAAYFGKPIVVTASGGLKEAVEDGVTGFVTHNDEELYLRIAELLKDESLRFSLGDEGRARVEERFLIK